jgi:hypothetical protein
MLRLSGPALPPILAAHAPRPKTTWAVLMARVDAVIAGLGTTRRRLIADGERFDAAHFVQQPPGGGWSAGQLFEHLARVESSIVRGGRKALETGSRARRTARDRIVQLIFWRGDLARFVRVRTPAAADPVEPLGREAAFARVAAVRVETLALLNEVRDRDLGGLCLRHPLFGGLLWMDMMEWIGWHEERHHRQLVRVGRALGVA